jgi:hypothetical protein
LNPYCKLFSTLMTEATCMEISDQLTFNAELKTTSIP